MTTQTAQIPHFIDGHRTVGQSQRTSDVFDPNTGEGGAEFHLPTMQ